MTQCSQGGLEFQKLAGRDVVANFDGGKVTSDAGGVLLREVEARFGFLRQFARCFSDFRDPTGSSTPSKSCSNSGFMPSALATKTSMTTTDSASIHCSPSSVDKKDPEGLTRHRAEDRGKALAGKIGAVIQVTVRKVWLSLSELYPFQETFRKVYDNLQRCPVRFASSG